MPPCEMKPADKKAFVGAVGQELVSKHGKKKCYQPKHVREAAVARGYDIDVVCWAYCVFCSPSDFAALHSAAGEVCDYVAMKAEVLKDLSPDGTFDWLDIDLSWLDWPDIDLSSVFEWFDFT